MEKSIDNMKKERNLACEPEQMSSLVLAYIGDLVYELMVRAYLVEKGVCKVNLLHKEAIRMVKAESQAHVAHGLESELDAQETAILKRGRNAQGGRVPKNAEVSDYRYATGLEALFGYWYLKGKQDRLDWGFERAVELIELKGE